MKKTIATLLFVAGHCVAATDVVRDIETVSDFAIQCQHPALKSSPRERVEACARLIDREQERIATKNQSRACLSALENLSRIGIFDSMFLLAADPSSRREPYRSALSEIILIAAPACQ